MPFYYSCDTFNISSGWVESEQGLQRLGCICLATLIVRNPGVKSLNCFLPPEPTTLITALARIQICQPSLLVLPAIPSTFWEADSQSTSSLSTSANDLFVPFYTYIIAPKLMLSQKDLSLPLALFFLYKINFFYYCGFFRLYFPSNGSPQSYI